MYMYIYMYMYRCMCMCMCMCMYMYVSSKIPPFARHLLVSVLFSALGRARRRQPRVGSPEPPKKVLRPTGARHLYKWNLQAPTREFWIQLELTFTHFLVTMGGKRPKSSNSFLVSSLLYTTSVLQYISTFRLLIGALCSSP